MKAAIVKSPGTLSVRDLPMPDIGPYDVLTEQLFGGVCAATDRHLIKGELPIPGITYPLILGHESIGRVVEAGAKVRHIEPGDLLTRTGAPALDGCASFWGGFAEFGIGKDVEAMKADGLPEEEWSAHEVNKILPPDFDPAAATMMITWRETYSYATRLGLKAGQDVLILGSGGNGFAFAALAAAFGAGSISMVGNPHWKDLAARTGVSAFADYRQEDYADTLRQAVPGGFDLVIDAVGRKGGIEAIMPLVKPEGAIGLYGIEDLSDRLGFLEGLNGRDMRVHGPVEYKEAEAHDAVIELVRAGKLNADIWFDPDNAYPLEHIQEAIDDIDAKRSLKAVIDLRASR